MTRTEGFSLIETIVAIGVLGIVASFIMLGFGNSLASTRDAGIRTQSSLLLNYLGRRVVGGDGAVLPAADEPLEWDYGALGTAFPELADDGVDPAAFRARVANTGAVAFAGATAIGYRIEVCSGGAGGDSCVTAATLGPPPPPAGGAAGPPGEFVN